MNKKTGTNMNETILFYTRQHFIKIFFMEYRINSKRDIYSMCRCCWNIATWKMDVENLQREY
jgi:hypothetical protein